STNATVARKCASTHGALVIADEAPARVATGSSGSRWKKGRTSGNAVNSTADAPIVTAPKRNRIGIAMASSRVGAVRGTAPRDSERCNHAGRPYSSGVKMCEAGPADAPTPGRPTTVLDRQISTD